MIVALLISLYLVQLANTQQPPLFPPVIPSKKKVINIGALFVDDNSIYSPYVGYTGSIGALYLAIDSIRDRHLLDGFTFNVTVRYDNCVERNAAGYTFELIRDYKVDIIIGPTCNVRE
ncbi:unnamed protein product [Strongylus vulgaris]|uniref:Receptor ligand binding region domain-containing protein n=1 Tax=Strongylus vulgaris TaxID=40348 RepID=A0A3P7JW67_STRVU|nr:unnamed protein product [Strongylus vulgaris]